MPPKVAFPERTDVTVVSGRRDHRAVTLREAGAVEVLVSLARPVLPPRLDQLSKVWGESYEDL